MGDRGRWRCSVIDHIGLWLFVEEQPPSQNNLTNGLIQRNGTLSHSGTLIGRAGYASHSFPYVHSSVPDRIVWKVFEEFLVLILAFRTGDLVPNGTEGRRTGLLHNVGIFQVKNEGCAKGMA